MRVEDIESVLEKAVHTGDQASRLPGEQHLCEGLLSRCDWSVTGRLACAALHVLPIRGSDCRVQPHKQPTGSSGTVGEEASMVPGRRR